MQFKITARPDFTRLPDMTLPFFVRSTGFYDMPAHYRSLAIKTQGFVQIFWCAGGYGELKLDDVVYNLEPGALAWKLFSESHTYTAGEKGWSLRWFTLDGPQAETFIKGYGYPRQISGAGKCPDHLFDAIEENLQEISPFSQRHLISIATEILALAGSHDQEKSIVEKTVSRFLKLVHQNYANESVNVNGLADIIGVHRSTLTRYFRKIMKSSPGEYLIRQRVQHALTLLRESDMPVHEVAALSGIPNPSYFNRAIRHATGLNPKAFRENGKQ